MVRITYQDEDGRKFVVLVPEGQEDNPERGIHIGPPHLDEAGLPFDVEVALNNQLFNRGLITKADLRGRGAELTAAFQTAFKSSANKIAGLYEG